MIDFSKTPLFLAPMAGFSDLPFRGVVKKFGCDVTISEMISSNALVYERVKTLEMMKKNKLETPYIVQIAGNNTNIIKQAVEILNDFDGIDGIDLNCGCPVPKVVKQNSGSALLKDPKNLCNILETIKKTSNKYYTSVKIRLGFNQKDSYKIAKDLENAGVDYIAVHGRTRASGYSGEADYYAIKHIKDMVKIPVIANGDIDDKNIKEVLEISNCDGAMIGRATIGTPWIFYKIKNKNSIDNKLKKDIIIVHFLQMLEHYGDHGIAIFRKHLHGYSKGMEGASNFRNKINKLNNSDEILEAINSFFI